MSATLHIAVDDQVAQEIRELAATLQKTPEETADEVVANGLLMLRRYAFLKKKSESTPDVVARGLEVLRHAGNGNPPDLGDELPEDLQYLLTERNR